jgi:hypothetical protein
VTAGTETLVVGAACPGAPGEVQVASPAGPGCVAEDALAPILSKDAGPLAWVDRALIVPGEPKRIAVEEAGRKLAIDDPGAEGARAWLEELAGFRAAEVVAAPIVEPGLPRLTIDGQRLWLSRRLGPRVEVRRAGEPVALLVDGDAARFFQADPLPFRDREVLRFEPTALREVSSAAETAVRGESIDDWRLTRPLVLAADPEAIEALRQTAAHLRAERFVAAAPSAVHRLAEKVTFVLDPPPTAPDDAPPERQTIVLGADVEGGCFAQKQGDPAVFVLAAAACRTLRASRATREIFTAPAEALGAVTIGANRYQKDGTRWHRASGAPLSEAEGTALEALVQALREAPEAQGYGEVHPRTKVVLEAGPDKVELLLAPPSYGVAGRPVRYRLAAEACSAWPSICR